MPDDHDQAIGLAEAIELLHDQLEEARKAGAERDVQFPIESMTIKLKVAATKSRDGKAGFSVPIVNLELGGEIGWQRESLQTVTVVFGSPVDRDGNPLKVSSASDELKG